MKNLQNLQNLTLRQSFSNRGALWTPADLGAGLAFWVDANTTPSITLNGSNVSQWNDLSGNNRHLIQGVALNQLALITGSINEIRSDGVDDSMSTGSFSISQPFARFSVITRRSSGNGSILNNINATPNIPLSTSASNQINMFAGAASITSSFSLNERRLFGEVFNGASSILFNNGTGSAFTNIGTNAFNSVRISGGIALSTGFHSVIVMNRLPTTIERQRIEGYLAHRYGLQASLPSGHPFLNAPPTK